MKTKIERTRKQTKYNNDNNKLIRRGKMKYFSIIFTLMVTALIGRSSETLETGRRGARRHQGAIGGAHREFETLARPAPVQQEGGGLDL